MDVVMALAAVIALLVCGYVLGYRQGMRDTRELWVSSYDESGRKGD